MPLNLQQYCLYLIFELTIIIYNKNRYDARFENLPEDQGGAGRHRCAGCAYQNITVR